MAQVTFVFDTGSVTANDLNDTLALAYGYQDIINGQPNPETKAQFNKRMVGRKIWHDYKHQKAVLAEAQAREALPVVPEFT